MLRYLFSGNGITGYLIQIAMCLPIVFLSLSLHESAHGFLAYKCGDPTARNLGRITLNPVKHLDPIGLLSMLLLGYGWAKPVPVNSRNFRKPKAGMILTAVAGPVSNLLLGFVFAVILRFTYIPLFKAMWEASTDQQAMILQYVIIFIYLAAQLNVSLALFNLIPIPPYDGSRILFALLPAKAYFKIVPYERYINIIFVVLLIAGVFTTPLSWATNLIMKGFFSILSIPDIFGIF